jgi:hypothetical protein
MLLLPTDQFPEDELLDGSLKVNVHTKQPFVKLLGLVVNIASAVQRQGIVTEFTDPVKVNVPVSGQLI